MSLRATTSALLAIFAALNWGPAAARAEDKDVIVVQWLDHFTLGAVNTGIGLFYGGAGVAYNRIFDSDNAGSPGLHIDSSGQQIVIEGSGFSGRYAQNSGLFQFTKYDQSYDEHEAGHGKTSGLLGPFYLPVLGIDMLLEGYNSDNLTESWAEANRNLGAEMLNSHPLHLRGGLIERNGRRQYSLGFETSLLERNAKVTMRTYYDGPNDNINYARTRFKYLTIGASFLRDAANSQTCPPANSGTLPIVVKASLLDRDFLVQWKALTPALRVLIDGANETGGVTIDFEHKRVEGVLLDQTVGFGLRLGNPKKVSLDAKVSAHGSIKGIWNYGASSPDEVAPGFIVVGGYRGGAKATILDSGEAYVSLDRDYGTRGYRSKKMTVGITSRDLFKSDDFTHGGDSRATAKKNKLDVYNSQFSGPYSYCVQDSTDPYEYMKCDYDGSHEGEGKSYIKPRQPARIYGGAEFSDETETQNKGDTNSTTHIKALVFHVDGRF